MSPSQFLAHLESLSAYLPRRICVRCVVIATLHRAQLRHQLEEGEQLAPQTSNLDKRAPWGRFHTTHESSQNKPVSSVTEPCWEGWGVLGRTTVLAQVPAPLVCPPQGYIDKAGWSVSFELSGSTCLCPAHPAALTSPRDGSSEIVLLPRGFINQSFYGDGSYRMPAPRQSKGKETRRETEAWPKWGSKMTIFVQWG